LSNRPPVRTGRGELSSPGPIYSIGATVLVVADPGKNGNGNHSGNGEVNGNAKAAPQAPPAPASNYENVRAARRTPRVERLPEPCDCPECRREAAKLRQRQAWKRFEEDDHTPPFERLERWLSWRGFSPDGREIVFALGDALRIYLAAWDEAVEWYFEPDKRAPRPAVMNETADITNNPAANGEGSALTSSVEGAGVSLVDALRSLGLDDDEIALLHWTRFEGYTQTEAARLLDITQGWASVKLKTAKEKLAAAGLVLVDVDKLPNPTVSRVDPAELDRYHASSREPTPGE
jgi:hypothetical protein